MKKLIFLVISLVLAFNLFSQLSFSQEPDKVFYFDFTITRNDEVKLLKLEFGTGKISDFAYQSDYTIKIISIDGKTLFEKPISIVFTAEALPYENETEHVIELNETSKFLRLPFYPTARYIAIYHSGKELFSADLKYYICNKNSVCDLGENEYNCPEDCKIETRGDFLWLYISMSIICIIVLTIIFYKKSQSKNKESDWQKVYNKWQ
jgi:hypothetical protein